LKSVSISRIHPEAASCGTLPQPKGGYGPPTFEELSHKVFPTPARKTGRDNRARQILEPQIRQAPRIPATRAHAINSHANRTVVFKNNQLGGSVKMGSASTRRISKLLFCPRCRERVLLGNHVSAGFFRVVSLFTHASCQHC
jgi:hypothetical protein